MQEGISFGQWLKSRRKALDLSQPELAARVGCSARTIEKLEADTRRPSKQLAALLAAALGVLPVDQARFVVFARNPANSAPVNSAPALPASGAPEPTPTRRRPAPLPAPANPFIGRAQAKAALMNLLQRSDVRLVTLTGPPGVGKTRLAVYVATALQASFRDGAAFVALAAVHDSALVAATIAGALGIRSSPGATAEESLQQMLREKPLLLVLDNFEQIGAAAPVLGTLLTSSCSLTCLVTSRTRLGIYGEYEFVVPPLALPDRALTRALKSRGGSLPAAGLPVETRCAGASTSLPTLEPGDPPTF